MQSRRNSLVCPQPSAILPIGVAGYAGGQGTLVQQTTQRRVPIADDHHRSPEYLWQTRLAPVALHFDRLVEEAATTCHGKSWRSAPDQHLRALALDALQLLDGPAAPKVCIKNVPYRNSALRL
jgi:hypothetical protein